MSFGQQRQRALLQGRIGSRLRSLSCFFLVQGALQLPQTPFGYRTCFVIDAKEVWHRRNNISSFLRLFQSVKQDSFAINHFLRYKQIGSDKTDRRATTPAGALRFGRHISDSEYTLNECLRGLQGSATFEVSDRRW